jgi:decaprenyl-phosphate phosphoribosyltransferase
MTTVHPSLAGSWIRAARPHQWIKALLVAVTPLVALHVSTIGLVRLIVAVVLSCLAASGTYLLNDSIDVAADRLHPTKRYRPIAAGLIARRTAIVVAVTLLAAVPLVGLLINTSTSVALAAYGVLTVSYSTKLKQVSILDVVTIAAGFVVRVIIGAVATDTTVSGWFLLAVGSAALMVAAGKRRGELRELGSLAAAHRRSLAVYRDTVTSWLLALSAVTLLTAMLAWATIGKGGPRLDELWALAVVSSAAIGICRYLRIAQFGDAARPEELVRDRWLQATLVVTATIYVVGRAVP